MGMYTQVCGVLNIGSINWGDKIKSVEKAVDAACSALDGNSDYWSPKQIRQHLHVLNGGNASVFLAVACEGKIIGYGNDWEKTLERICHHLPTAEGRIEWLYEDDATEDIVWIVSNGHINRTVQAGYRNGYGNGC